MVNGPRSLVAGNSLPAARPVKPRRASFHSGGAREAGSVPEHYPQVIPIRIEKPATDGAGEPSK